MMKMDSRYEQLDVSSQEIQPTNEVICIRANQMFIQDIEELGAGEDCMFDCFTRERTGKIPQTEELL